MKSKKIFKSIFRIFKFYINKEYHLGSKFLKANKKLFKDLEPEISFRGSKMVITFKNNGKSIRITIGKDFFSGEFYLSNTIKYTFFEGELRSTFKKLLN